MTDRYEIAFRSDPTKQGIYRSRWIPGCPLFAEAIQVPIDTQTGDAYLQVKFVNVSRLVITSFTAYASVLYADGSEEIIQVAPSGIELEPGQPCLPAPYKLRQADVKTARAEIEVVSHANGEWTSMGALPAPLPLNDVYTFPEKARNERARLFEKAGITDPEAVDRMLYNSDYGWWICPCGALNVDRSTCRTCDQTLEQLRRLENEPYLNESADAHQLHERYIAEQNAERKMRNMRLIGIGAAVAVVVVALIVAIAMFAGPTDSSLEGRLASRTWQTTTDPTGTYNVSTDIKIDATFGNGEVKFKWGSIEIGSGTYNVTDNETVEINVNGVPQTWHVTFANNQMTADSNGTQTVFTAA